MSHPATQPSERRYQRLWTLLKTVKVGDPVKVKVHKSAVKTVKEGLMKEKSKETAMRRKLGERFAGKMLVEVVEKDAPEGYVFLLFRLSWDGTRL